MTTQSRAAWIGAIGALAGALISAGVTLFVEEQKIGLEKEQRSRVEGELKVYRQMYESAPQQFVKELGRLIDDAPLTIDDRPDTSNPQGDSVLISARAIVSARNDLRTTLGNLGSDLDSEIDKLQTELVSNKRDQHEILQTLRVLREKWPIKSKQIEVDVRKLLAVIGIAPLTAGIPKTRSTSLNLSGVWYWEGEGVVYVRQEGDQVEASLLEAAVGKGRRFAFKPGQRIFNGSIQACARSGVVQVLCVRPSSDAERPTDFLLGVRLTASEDGALLQGSITSSHLSLGGDVVNEAIPLKFRKVA